MIVSKIYKVTQKDRSFIDDETEFVLFLLIPFFKAGVRKAKFISLSKVLSHENLGYNQR